VPHFGFSSQEKFGIGLLNTINRPKYLWLNHLCCTSISASRQGDTDYISYGYEYLEYSPCPVRLKACKAFRIPFRFVHKCLLNGGVHEAFCGEGMKYCRAITEEPEFCGEHNQFWPLCMKQKEAEIKRLKVFLRNEISLCCCWAGGIGSEGIENQPCERCDRVRAVLKEEQ
jgi:hypothetical protein